MDKKDRRPRTHVNGEPTPLHLTRVYARIYTDLHWKSGALVAKSEYKMWSRQGWNMYTDENGKWE